MKISLHIECLDGIWILDTANVTNSGLASLLGGMKTNRRAFPTKELAMEAMRGMVEEELARATVTAHASGGAL